MKTITIRTAATAFYLASCIGVPAHSEEDSAPEANFNRGQNDSRRVGRIEEVIVTATKRAESVLDIPISIAVIGNQDIERRGVIGMEDYLRSVPGVNQIDQGPRSNAIVIRGIATSLENQNQSSGATVATYFDETPITGAGGPVSGGVDVRPVDIERIEVLRGPQGTAYGSSSLSGTVRMIPKKPNAEIVEARLLASYSDTENAGGGNAMMQGVVNIPLVESKFAVRAVGYKYDDSGFYQNIAGRDSATIASAEAVGLGDYIRGHVQDDIGRLKSTGGRIAALWKPVTNLDVSILHLTQRLEQNGEPHSSAGLGSSLGSFEQAEVPIAPQARVRGQVGEANDTDLSLTNIVIDYDFQWAALTSAFSWIESESVTARALGNAGLGPVSFTIPSEFSSFTAETRLASQLQGPFQFLAGLFMENTDDELRQTIDWPGAGSPFGTNPIYYRDQKRDVDQRAIFAELSYDLTSKLTAKIGGRYFKYEKEQLQLQEGGLLGVPLGSGLVEDVNSEEDDVNFMASLTYKLAADARLYASWAQGFRLGQPTPGLVPFAAICDVDGNGIVDGTNITLDSTQNVESDFLDSYEIGGKFALLDRRFNVDIALYHTAWDGLPIAVSAGSCPAGYIANAGEATSDGAEIQTSVLLGENLKLNLGAAYTKAELSKDAPSLGVLDGARLPGSPKVNANIAAEYSFDLAGYAAFVRADAIYIGKFYGDLQESPTLEAGDYIKADARMGVEVKNLGVEVFVRNLTNEDALTWRGFGIPTPTSYRLRPRTIGIQLQYTF